MRFATLVLSSQRFARLLSLAFVAAALALVTGCGSSSSPSGPTAAWTVNFDSGGNESCVHGAPIQDSYGSLSDSLNTDPVQAGQPVPDETDTSPSLITCSVTGSSTFVASGTAATQDQSMSLSINIPSITASATESNPVMGTASYSSAQYTAQNVYEGSCAFYFKTAPPEGIAAGRIWAAYACPMVTNSGGQHDTCAITESFFLFEDCN